MNTEARGCGQPATRIIEVRKPDPDDRVAAVVREVSRG